MPSHSQPPGVSGCGCRKRTRSCLLDLEINGGAVQITVWDGDTTLPSVLAADPGGDVSGHHSR
ncbi:hypothetical protein [Streptomyces sp. NPDC057690]|uniref:hypothetical protein n=1 Tax=Streptomyces sp. NPDC057690 TaxID=3346214 RepID=UPI00369B3BD4